MSKVRETVVAFLMSITTAERPSEIAFYTRMKGPSVRRELQNLLRRGLVIRNTQGAYRLAADVAAAEIVPGESNATL